MKVYTVSMAFCPARILALSMKRYAETRNQELAYEHIIVDQHYPLNREQNLADLKAICQEHGATYFDSGFDRGLHRGFNNLTSTLPLQDDDLLIGYDPDSYPLSSGWDMGLVTVLMNDPQIAVAGLSSYVTFPTPNVRWEDRMAGHVRYKVARGTPAQMNVCCWRWSFLKAIGGLSQPKNFYGHLESYIWVQLAKMKMAKGYLVDWTEDFRLCSMHDREYLLWKKIHAHTNDFPGSFKEFLESGCPNPRNL